MENGREKRNRKYIITRGYKMKKKIALFMILLLLFTVEVSAHPGGTDSSGGHWNHSTGEYHYHHGYPEHQHPDGVCPYDYNDATEHTSSSSSVKKPFDYKLLVTVLCIGGATILIYVETRK